LALGNWREVINAKPLEIASFHLCHIFLRLGKLSHLPNQLCKTVGDALKAAIFRVVLSQTFTTLIKFIEKNAKIYSTKLIPLNLL